MKGRYDRQRFDQRRGQAAIGITLSMTLLCGVLGFVTDLGWAYYRRQVAQTSADAAVSAGAAFARANGLVCGKNGVLCQATPLNCAGITGVSSLATACAYASKNGFTDGSNNQTVTVMAGIGTPPGASNVTVDYWVQVAVSENISQLFSRVLGHNALTTGAVSVSGLSAGAAGGTTFVLGNGPSTVTTDGGATVNTGGDIWVKSTDPGAVVTKGNDNVSVNGGGKVHVGGGCNRGGSSQIYPPAETNCGANDHRFDDPYSKMQEPTDDGHCDDDWWWWGSHNYQSGNITLNPGNYCEDIDIGGSATVTLNPGVYNIKGHLRCTGGTVTGNGVCLHVEYNDLTISGGTVNLSPPTSGNWKGITVYQPSSNTSQCTLSAGSTQKCSGVIYAPGATVSHCGGQAASSPKQTIVCNKLALTGTTHNAGAASSIYTASPGSICR